jgi:metalloendopeptidase OMA1, mitochondrial
MLARLHRCRSKIGRAAAILAMAGLAACQQAPVTGRSQLVLVSAEQADQLGVEAYKQIKAEEKVSQDPEMNRMVEDVSQRLAKVVNRPDYDWQYTVFENPEPNAFALPGGKIGVYSGLFKVVHNEAQLAAVLGHEVGHVVANHVAERMSREALVQTGLGVLDGTGAGQYSGLLAQAATLGVVLPFSREQEAEADEIGLMLMARAGYDPQAAVQVWRNFESVGGQRPPEFLSDHPAPGNRIQHLQQIMPRAQAAYQATRAQSQAGLPQPGAQEKNQN